MFAEYKEERRKEIYTLFPGRFLIIPMQRYRDITLGGAMEKGLDRDISLP